MQIEIDLLRSIGNYKISDNNDTAGFQLVHLIVERGEYTIDVKIVEARDVVQDRRIENAIQRLCGKNHVADVANHVREGGTPEPGACSLHCDRISIHTN